MFQEEGFSLKKDKHLLTDIWFILISAAGGFRSFAYRDVDRLDARNAGRRLHPLHDEAPLAVHGA